MFEHMRFLIGTSKQIISFLEIGATKVNLGFGIDYKNFVNDVNND